VRLRERTWRLYDSIEKKALSKMCSSMNLNSLWILLIFTNLPKPSYW
jgi:hypothetical protein